jgi:hypothetical protein
VIRLSRDQTRGTWRRGGGGGRHRTPAKPQTTREKEMSLFGRRNAKPRAKSKRGSDVTARRVVHFTSAPVAATGCR